MAASRLQCWQCGTAFYGRVDARYCCGACRQKAHRARATRRAADQVMRSPSLGHIATQARQTQETARNARACAEATRRASSATRAEARRHYAH
jgi:hypothetical protein